MGASAPIEYPQKIIVLFDGVCNLCNGAVQFIIRRDPGKKFLFAPLQSALGKKYLIQSGLDPFSLQSILVIDDHSVFQQSDAALKIAQHLDGFWSYLTILKWVPKIIRDAVYNFIARHRYTVFGQQASCMIPTPELKARFIDS